MVINTVGMPVKSPADDIFDTRRDYDKKVISHGSSLNHNIPLSNRAMISFVANKLVGFTQLDERNLVYCEQLNLNYSSLTSLCTKYLSYLRVLSLYKTKITSLLTENLINIEFLNISYTPMLELNTYYFKKIEQLWM